MVVFRGGSVCRVNLLVFLLLRVLSCLAFLFLVGEHFLTGGGRFFEVCGNGVMPGGVKDSTEKEVFMVGENWDMGSAGCEAGPGVFLVGVLSLVSGADALGVRVRKKFWML